MICAQSSLRFLVLYVRFGHIHSDRNSVANASGLSNRSPSSCHAASFAERSNIQCFCFFLHVNVLIATRRHYIKCRAHCRIWPKRQEHFYVYTRECSLTNREDFEETLLQPLQATYWRYFELTESGRQKCFRYKFIILR